MVEKLKNWKFMAIISGITLGLLFLSIYLYMYTHRWAITIMAVLFLSSFLWFIWLWTKKDGIRKILSLMVCSLGLAGAFFGIMYINHIEYNYYATDLWRNFGIIMIFIFGISIVSFFLLLIWKKENK